MAATASHSRAVDVVPEGEAEDMDQEDKLLMRRTIKLGLNTIQMTADGKGYAYARLDLQGRALTTLSGELSSYRELKHVNLASNHISSGLESLALLPQLVTITLQRNKIGYLPDLSPCKHLQILQADYNQILSLHGFKAPSLFAMTLSRNKISALSDVQGQFPSVESMDLSYNRISSLAGVENFPNVRHLNVSRNALASLGGVQALTELQSLDVSHNRIGSLEEFKVLGRLPNLITLIVGKNPGLKRAATAVAESADAASAESGAAGGAGGAGGTLGSDAGNEFAGDLLTELLVILPQLQCIDSHIITSQERASAAGLKRAREEVAALELALAEGEKAVAEAEARAAAAEKAATDAEEKRLAAELEDQHRHEREEGGGLDGEDGGGDQFGGDDGAVVEEGDEQQVGDGGDED